MRSVGIDIGTLSIKIAEVEDTSRGFAIRDYIQVAFNPDPSMDKKIQIADTLQKISQHYDNNTTRFVVGISQNKISVRRRTFPFTEKIKINRTLAFELEDEIPFDHGNAVFDAKILKQFGNESEVLAAACPKKYVSEILELCHDVGLDPDIISADGFALSNLFTPWNLPVPTEEITPIIETEDSEETSTFVPVLNCQVYLHMGNTETVMLLMNQGKLLAIRSFYFGGSRAIQEIQKTYDLPYADALKGLREKGFVLTHSEGASKDQVVFSETISKGLDKFTLDLKKTILEYESEMSIQVQQIYLMGGMSHLINIAPYFTQKLGVATNMLNHLNLGFRITAVESDEMQKDSAISIGLAVEGLKKPKNPPINFRQNEFAKEGQNFRIFLEKWNTTLKYTAAAIVLFFIYAFIRSDVSIRLNDLGYEAMRTAARSPLVGLKGSQSRERHIRKFIRDQKKILSNQEKLSGIQDIASPNDIIAHISRTLPPARQLPLDVKVLDIQDNKVQIQGEANNRNQIATIESRLKGISKNGQIKKIPPRIRASAGKTLFGFEFEYDRKARNL